jgi:hypothetical protein
MMIEDDGSSGPIPNHPNRPPSPASTGSALTVGTSQEAILIKSLEQGEYIPDDGNWDETRSLTDSIRQHIIDGGLRYHAYHAGQYAFPNDETEQYRDDLKHNLTIHLCEGSYFFAPIHERLLQPGAEVLDLGESLQSMSRRFTSPDNISNTTICYLSRFSFC